MKKIVKGRGRGKTYDLIKISAEKQIPILTAFDNRHIIQMAGEMGINKLPYPITLKQLNLVQYYNSDAPILVDNAEYVLQQLLHRPIEALSMNDDTEEDILKDAYDKLKAATKETRVTYEKFFDTYRKLYTDSK